MIYIASILISKHVHFKGNLPEYVNHANLREYPSKHYLNNSISISTDPLLVI